MSCVQFRHHKLQRELHNHWPAVKSLWIISLFLPFSLTHDSWTRSEFGVILCSGYRRSESLFFPFHFHTRHVLYCATVPNLHRFQHLPEKKQNKEKNTYYLQYTNVTSTVLRLRELISLLRGPLCFSCITFKSQSEVRITEWRALLLWRYFPES